MHSRHRLFVPAAVLTAVLYGCMAQHAQAPQGGQQPQTASSSFPVIVRMVARHQTITVTAGPHGPLYSAATDTGQSLVSNATLQQLRSDHPDIARQVEPTLALDARAD